ncbi:hypothetical protein P7C73_g1993, partial [Tremellales sp. Uapishka_1]
MSNQRAVAPHPSIKRDPYPTSNAHASPSSHSVTPIKRETPGRDDGGPKKKRVSLSCNQCAKRKQKVDWSTRVVAENVRLTSGNPTLSATEKSPVNIVPYNPAPSSSSANGPDAHTAARIDRIESVLSVLVRHTGGIGSYDSIRDWVSTAPFVNVLSSTPSTPSSPHGLLSFVAPQPRPIVAPDVERDEQEGGGSTEPEDGLGKAAKGWLGDLHGCVPETLKQKEKITIMVDAHGTPAERLQRLITDCGVSPHKLAELVQELPPKPFADRIIDYFFSKLNIVRYPIDERMFRIVYEDLYTKSNNVDPSNVRALPLIFIVLATAIRLAPTELAGDENTRKLSSLRMYWSSRRSVLIATAIQSESLELVVSRLLSAMYLFLIHDRRLTEGWSQLGASLRTAQAIGLHRDGTKLGLDLVLGRPPSISDSYSDTQPPSNLEMSDFVHPSVTFPRIRPLSEPTTSTFLILRGRMANICGRIVHHFQKLDEPAQYADVEKLQQELDLLVAQLPPHFRMIGPDKSLDKTLFWLPLHRYMLLTEITATTIILHRPWLLRRLSSDRYAASRTACFESVKLDFQIREDSKRDIPDLDLYGIGGHSKMFNSTMIAGISAIIDPRGPDAVQMRRILTTFLEQHPWQEVAELDETTRKEVSIIHTLSRRAAQLFEYSLSPAELNATDKDNVGLLLALRQSGGSGIPPPPPPLQTPQSGGNWAKPTSTNAPNQPFQWSGAMQSPTSSGHEDDHSQRLLDHWLNSNSALTIGSTRAASSTDAYIPNLPAGPNSFGGFSQPQQTGFAMAQGWLDDGQFQVPPQSQEFTYPISVDNVDQLGQGQGQENSDEYWNTLIDGILGTTGGIGGGQSNGN